MLPYSADGFVLRRYDLREADRIVVLYTRDRGKVSAVAKGAKRLHSKLAAACEPLTLNRYSISPGRNLDVISQAESRFTFHYVRADLERLAYAIYRADLADLFTDEHMPDEALFAHITGCMYLSEYGCDSETVTRYFETRLLRILGYMPDTERCCVCGKEFKEGGKVDFLPSSGGFACSDCGGGGTFPVSLLSYIRGLADLGPKKLIDITIPDGAKRDLEQVMRLCIENQLTKRLKSKEFVEIVKRLKRAAT